VAHRQPPEGDRRRRPARSGAGGPDLAPRGTPVLCETADEGMLAQAERYRTNEYDSLGYWAERDMDPDVLDRYRGSMFLIQGLQDWNVDPGHQYRSSTTWSSRGSTSST
jgi:hypothetical protein